MHEKHTHTHAHKSLMQLNMCVNKYKVYSYVLAKLSLSYPVNKKELKVCKEINMHYNNKYTAYKHI